MSPELESSRPAEGKTFLISDPPAILRTASVSLPVASGVIEFAAVLKAPGSLGAALVLWSGAALVPEGYLQVLKSEIPSHAESEGI